MPAAVPLLVGGAVATGAAATIGTAIAGAAVSSAVATGIGAAVVGAGAGLATGQSVGDALKTGVVGGLTAGVGSSIGSALAGAGTISDAAFVAADAAQLAGQGLSEAAIAQNLASAGVSSAAASKAASLAVSGATEAIISSNLSSGTLFSQPTMGNAAQGLLSEDFRFVGKDAAQLYAQTGDVAAVQQNLIAAGVDPIMAAEAANLAAFGGTGSSIAGSLGAAFPGQTVFTSQGLLGGGSTMDEFSKDIAGISSTSAPTSSITDALKRMNLGNQLMGGGQQTATGFPAQQAPFQPLGVDYSGVLGLLEQQARTPGVSSLAAPTQLQPMFQPTLLPNIMSLLG